MSLIFNQTRSQWLRCLRRGSAAARLLGLSVPTPPVAWMFVYCECFVLSCRGICVGLITHPEGSYRIWCVWVLSWILDNEETLAPLGAVEPWQKNIKSIKRFVKYVGRRNFTPQLCCCLLLFLSNPNIFSTLCSETFFIWPSFITWGQLSPNVMIIKQLHADPV
jgi:hypothetical protein